MYEVVRLRSTVVPAQPQADAGAVPATSRKIGTLVLAIFWLLLMEGALRKWVAPEYSRFLFFIRDPFVLLLYWKAWRMGAFRNADPFLSIGLMFAGVALLLSFAQSVTFGDTRILAVVVYGWRQYFLYLPLPFVMAATLNMDFLQRFARHTFVAAILMAPLVFLQFHSPPSAVVNRGISDDENLQFQSFAFTGGGVRPSGTFTSTVGVVHLIPSTLALLLGVWLTPKPRRKFSTAMLVVTAAGVATCLAMSGSRAAFIHVGLVVLSSMALGLVSRDFSIRTRALVIPLILLGLGIVLYPIVFPDALAAMLGRVAEAYSTESKGSSLGVFGRALWETLNFVGFLGDTPIQGYVFGIGGNGRTYLGTIDPELAGRVFAESDWSRHIVDFGPLFGILFIIYRIVFTLSVGIQALRATRLSASPFPLLLFGYMGIGLFYGQLTGHGTVGGFLWLYLGLCMTAIRSATPR